MAVRLTKIHGNLFPGDVAGFDAKIEAALVASGKAEAVKDEDDAEKVTTKPPASKAAKAPVTKG